MNKLMVTTAAVSLLGALATPVFAQDMSADATGHTVAFAAADANADGGVNFQGLQASAMPVTQAQFDSLDTDNNMTLDQQEFTTLVDSGVMASSSMGMSGEAGMANGAALKFNDFDANGDDSVTLQEIRAMDSAFSEDAFTKADYNNDKALDEQEFTTLIDSGAMASSSMGTSGEAGMANGATLKFNDFDANGDDSVTLQEVRARDSAFSEDEFNKADTNNDMALDQQEFTTVVDSGALAM